MTSPPGPLSPAQEAALDTMRGFVARASELARDLLERLREILRTYVRTVQEAWDTAFAFAVATPAPRDRPAWRSPHGPAHQRRRPA